MIFSKKTPELSIYLPHQESLIAVPFDHEDIPAVFDWKNNEAVYRFMGGKPLSDLVTLEEVMAPTVMRPEFKGRILHEWTIRMEDNTQVTTTSGSTYSE